MRERHLIVHVDHSFRRLFPYNKAELIKEKCDFQRSMANNEAKLKENEEKLHKARQDFVEELEKANSAYSRDRYEQQDRLISLTYA